jgi:hypothetical protein
MIGLVGRVYITGSVGRCTPNLPQLRVDRGTTMATEDPAIASYRGDDTLRERRKAYRK